MGLSSSKQNNDLEILQNQRDEERNIILSTQKKSSKVSKENKDLQEIKKEAREKLREIEKNLGFVDGKKRQKNKK